MEYAAKFVCGSLRDDFDVLFGVYATSINIHNPQNHDVTFCKKIVVARQEGKCPPPGSPRKICPRPVIIEDTLGGDLAQRVDCPLIHDLFVLSGQPDVNEPDRPDHIEGFVVIEVPPRSIELQPVLDVVGKYTARDLGTGVSTLDIVVYPGQRILKGQ